jgi:putative ABC transport system ATP-binding protein
MARDGEQPKHLPIPLKSPGATFSLTTPARPPGVQSPPAHPLLAPLRGKVRGQVRGQQRTRHNPIIRLEHISKRFANGNLGLHDVSLELYAGEVACIVGENGHGKSTLMNVLALSDANVSGRVIVQGQDVSQLSRRERDDVRGRRIEYIPQKGFGLVAKSPVNNIARWLRDCDNVAWRTAQQEARKALQAVGLPEETFRLRADKLSGGEQARVAIAKALARNRPILLGDEIFSPVHYDSYAPLINLLRQMASRGISVAVIVQGDKLPEYFDRVLVIRDHRLHDDYYN